jgi:hypothetical protein
MMDADVDVDALFYCARRRFASEILRVLYRLAEGLSYELPQ